MLKKGCSKDQKDLLICVSKKNVEFKDISKQDS